jgi:hypothetical protein
MARDEDLAGATTVSDSATWFAGYSARFAKITEDTARASVTMAGGGARRALADGEWTVDTVTADVIAEWEEMTALMDRGLDLWLEVLQQPIRGARRREG